MTLEFSNKVAVVTGASRGIGKGIALELARNGASIAIVYRSEEEKAKQVQTEIEEIGQEAMTIKCDVSNSGDVARLYDAVMDKWNRVDFVINNAGIHQHLKSWELSTRCKPLPRRPRPNSWCWLTSRPTNQKSASSMRLPFGCKANCKTLCKP